MNYLSCMYLHTLPVMQFTHNNQLYELCKSVWEFYKTYSWLIDTAPRIMLFCHVGIY